MGLYIPSDSPSCRLTSAPVSQKIQTCFQLPKAPQLLRKFLQNEELKLFSAVQLQFDSPPKHSHMYSPDDQIPCMHGLHVSLQGLCIVHGKQSELGGSESAWSPRFQGIQRRPVSQPILALGLFLSCLVLFILLHSHFHILY